MTMSTFASLNMSGSIVVTTTNPKTKSHSKGDKYYHKKQEKKKRDAMIKKNRAAKMDTNNVYSRREYVRHNGSKSFEIYTKHDFPTKYQEERQFMNQKDFELSIDYEMDEEESMYRQNWDDQHVYDDDELPEQAPKYMGNRKTKRSSSFDDYLVEPPTKKLKSKTNIHNEIKAELIQIRYEVDETLTFMKEEWERIDHKIKLLANNMNSVTEKTWMDDDDLNWMSESSRGYLVNSPDYDEDYYN
jgi:hypothetical protein